MAAPAWSGSARAGPLAAAASDGSTGPSGAMALQVAGKGLGTAGLAEVLVAMYRRQQKKWLRQQGSQPQSVGQLVTALDASRNEVEGLPWASPEACLVLYNLTELRLAHNCLRSDCSAFKPLRRLVHLDLSHNQLTSTAGLDGSLPQLQVLNLAHNALTEVEGLVGLPVLTSLDLTANRIRSAQRLRLLSLNTRLRVLHLKGNPLAGNCRVGVLHLLPSLQQLDGAPCPPARAASSGLDAAAASSSSYGSIHVSTHQRKRSEGDHRPRYTKETHAERFRCGLEPHASIVGGGAKVAAPASPPPTTTQRPDDVARATAAARRDRQGFRSPPPQLLRAPPPPGYVPPWRRLPNPLPRGWRDYAGLAAQGLVGRD